MEASERLAPVFHNQNKPPVVNARVPDPRVRSRSKGHKLL